MEALELLIGALLSQQQPVFHAKRAASLPGLRTFMAGMHARDWGMTDSTVPDTGDAASSGEEKYYSSLPQDVQKSSSQPDSPAAMRDAEDTSTDVLHAWQALSRVPLEGTLLEELACVRCRGALPSHVQPMLALPLTLPTMQVRSSLSPLEQSLI